MTLSAVVLAAGQGKRMKSALPKVLHRCAGATMLEHVLAALDPLDLEDIVVVTSRDGDRFEAALGERDVRLTLQDPPRGTGDAARVGLQALPSRDGVVLVVPGDTPLLTTDSLVALARAHDESGASATVLTSFVEDPSGYGRVVRDAAGAVTQIVEERDASEHQRLLREVNTSIYVFEAERLAWALARIDDANAQGELYLTDTIRVLVSAGDAVAACAAPYGEMAGVNSRSQLAAAAAALRRRAAERLMVEGVTIIDPATTYIDTTVTVGRDAVIHPNTYLEGTTSIGERAEIGPSARLVDTEVGDGAAVSFAVVLSSRLGEDSSVGPFASVRPGTRLGRGAKIGTFVETKNTTIGEGSKANHLAYLGDAEIGGGVNVGAGTITCNWDGQKKHNTVIEDDAYIGSDTMLVAPVHIGRRAATGAGSVVTSDVPDDALAVGVPATVLEERGDKMNRRNDRAEPPDAQQ